MTFMPLLLAIVGKKVLYCLPIDDLLDWQTLLVVVSLGTDEVMKLALRADDDLFPSVILNSSYSFLLSLRATSHMLSKLVQILVVLAT
jgi:hypothetical protein